MARCNNDLLLKKIGIKTLGENTEIDFRIRKDLADCRKINAKDYVKLSEGANVTFNRYRKPENRFECMRKGCVNTGLLMTSAANTAVTYLARFDATEFAAGVITFYVYPNGTAPVTVTVSISDTHLGIVCSANVPPLFPCPYNSMRRTANPICVTACAMPVMCGSSMSPVYPCSRMSIGYFFFS